MSPFAQRCTVITLVAVHTLLLAAYTLPEGFVPDRLLDVSRIVVRPLFHQEWHLFSPDPPVCSCELDVAVDGKRIAPVLPNDANYLRKRMARHLADHVGESVTPEQPVPIPILQAAMRSMARDVARDTDRLEFRLVQHCALDPALPAERKERITPLVLTAP
jgi:hypothetical protein